MRETSEHESCELVFTMTKRVRNTARVPCAHALRDTSLLEDPTQGDPDQADAAQGDAEQAHTREAARPLLMFR